MIDKELIRQAAEDIDLFGEDLSAEFDRLSQPKKRAGNISPFRGLGGLMAAACIALLFVVGISVRLLTSEPNDSSNLVSRQVNTTKDTASIYVRNLAQAHPTPEGEKDGEGQLAIHHTPRILTKVKSQGMGGLEKAEEVLQEEDEYSEALLYALITEVEAKAMVEQAEEERLYQTLIEEISTNISKETTQTELTL